MSDALEIDRHYASGGPKDRVLAALDGAFPGGGRLTVEQLGGFDDFHTGGRLATARAADLLHPSAGDTVLDAGAGLGGPARYLAARFGCRVVGIDLTPEFVEIGTVLNERTGLRDRVELRVGDITATGLPDASVDHVWTHHVAMNIADREALYAELRRVMRPGGRFVLFDVVDGGGGELLLPVPWATRPEHSHLVTADELRPLLESAGFRVDVWEDPTGEMLEGLRRMLSAPAGASPPLLAAPLYIDDLATKADRYLHNLRDGRTALVLAGCTAV